MIAPNAGSVAKQLMAAQKQGMAGPMKEEHKATEMVKQPPMDFAKLVQRSSIEEARERAIKERNAEGKDVLDAYNKGGGRYGKDNPIHKKELDKDDFLNLFITQLKVQDPTKPLDNIELAQQMAQFNSLEQLMGVAKGVEKLNQINNQSNEHDMVNYIGKMIEIEGGKLNYTGEPIKAHFNLDRDVTKGTLKVRDDMGQVIKQIPISSLKKGQNSITWDGKSADGRDNGNGLFYYEVEATDVEGKNAQVSVKNFSEVKGVAALGGKPVFLTDLGRIPINEVQSVKIKEQVEQIKKEQAKVLPQSGPAKSKKEGNMMEIPVPSALGQDKKVAAAEEPQTTPVEKKEEKPSVEKVVKKKNSYAPASPVFKPVQFNRLRDSALA